MNPNFEMRGGLRPLLSCLLASSLIGCAGDIKVLDASGRELPGVPVLIRQSVIKRGFHNTLAKGGACQRTPFAQIDAVPAQLIYVRPVTAPLAKTGFEIKMDSSGAVSDVSLNSEPSGADQITAATGFLKTVLGAAGLGAAAAPPPGGAATLPACDAGEDQVTFEPFALNRP